MNNEEKILAILEKQSEMFERVFSRMDKMQEDISGIKVRLDYDTDVRLKALSEGQDMIEKRLDSLEDKMSAVQRLAEATSDKVDVIHAAVTQHSADITELKKAQ